jgi:GNAT superfamily N-acetyltransferase
MSVREATVEDIAVIFDIRVSVRENPATRQQLRDLGIDEQSVAAAITAAGRGWIAEEEDRAVGFTIANRLEGSIFALYVRPEFEGLGHGGRLLDAAVQWLFSQKRERLTLTTAPNTRAHRFYLKRGWIQTGKVEPNGDIELELAACLPDS